MDKITDFLGINKYWCSECNCFHIKKYKKKTIIDDNFNEQIVKTKDTPFFNHKEFAYKLSSTELRKLQFHKSWKKYDLNKVFKKISKIQKYKQKTNKIKADKKR